MRFGIADTFQRSLSKLTNQEQKAVKVTAVDLQLDPTNPGMKFHRIDRSKDPNFWSLRVNRDIRIIVHKTAASILLCYADHHDRAYAWAERRKIERHPKTGAAQLVEVRETVQEIPQYVPDAISMSPNVAQPTFAAMSDEALLAYGVPSDWIEDVRGADEDRLLELIAHLPEEAAETLLDIATGSKPHTPRVSLSVQALDAAEESIGPPIAEEEITIHAYEMRAPITPRMDEGLDSASFEHPDAQRRFRSIASSEELERALDYPWEEWTVFLHPAQRRFVEQDYDGPVRISGSAGTGKTIVALHRAVTLARRNPDANVAITTFSPALSNALKQKLEHLIGNEPNIRKRIFVYPVSGIGYESYKRLFGEPSLATAEQVRVLIEQTAERLNVTKFPLSFLVGEWESVIDAWQVKSWEAYRDTPRLGRKLRLGEQQRQDLWKIFAEVRRELEVRGHLTWPELYARITDRLKGSDDTLFDFVVVDEAQDVSVPELRFLAALGSKRANGLFFTGDLGQRIFQQPFSWLSLGVDVQGRSYTLRVNYRTSQQIRRQADRLLPQSISDVDGIEETRGETISLLNGPPPIIRICDDFASEKKEVSNWLKARVAENVASHEIGVFVRSDEQLARAQDAILAAGLNVVELTENIVSKPDHVSLGTMHMAKGLEFRAVAVMACDEEILPLQERIESVSDPSDLEEVYNSERHLLYVACTRARDHLLITAVEPASEFLDDFGSILIG